MKYARLEYCRMDRADCLFPGTAPMWRPAWRWNSYDSTHADLHYRGKVRELYFWFNGVQHHLKLSTRT